MDIPLSLVVWHCPTQASAPESRRKRRARRTPSPRICLSVLRLRERLTCATGRHRRRETDSRVAENFSARADSLGRSPKGTMLPKRSAPRNTSAPELFELLCDEAVDRRADGRLTLTVDDPVIAIGHSTAAVRAHAQVPQHMERGHGVSSSIGSLDVVHAGLERSPESEVAERCI